MAFARRAKIILACIAKELAINVRKFVACST